MKVTDEEMARFRGDRPSVLRPRDINQVLSAVVNGFTYDPGHSDLDNDQPINVRLTLGQWRVANRLLTQLKDEAK